MFPCITNLAVSIPSKGWKGLIAQIAAICFAFVGLVIVGVGFSIGKSTDKPLPVHRRTTNATTRTTKINENNTTNRQ